MFQMETWPNFFIVGAPRCGTTSLWYYLNQSPEIFMSSKKEPWYFNSPKYVNVYPEKPIHEKKEYLSLFQGVQNEKLVGEASTTYLADPTTPDRIHKILPESRIINLERIHERPDYQTALERGGPYAYA